MLSLTVFYVNHQDLQVGRSLIIPHRLTGYWWYDVFLPISHFLCDCLSSRECCLFSTRGFWLYMTKVSFNTDIAGRWDMSRECLCIRFLFNKRTLREISNAAVY